VVEVMDRRFEGETKRAGAPCANAPVPAVEPIRKEPLHRIVVVGGGAAGLRLGNRWGRCSRASVALVECARTHVWKPLPHVDEAALMPAICNRLRQ
jgi:NADH:quinone reductase (non-electrogenic)